MRKKWQDTSLPKIVLEVWLLLILTTQLLALFFWQEYSNTMQIFFVIISIISLLDFLSSTLRDVLLAPNLHNGHIQIRDPQRWLALTVLSIFEIILSFAIIMLKYKNQFHTATPESFDSLTAIYFSTVTFLTVGYGDIYPVHVISKIIILGELCFFLVFVALKLPIAISMIQVKNKPDE